MVSTAPVTLLCLPYAGGSSTIYRGWAERMPRGVQLVPLNLPGRGARVGMPPVHEWPRLLDLIVDDVKPYLNRPFALFGHSMGALLGIELAFELRSRYGAEPVWFGASGCAAPSRREYESKWLACSSEELMAELVSLDGTPPEVLDNPELMALLAPVLRADFHLCGTHEYRRRAPLSCPMLVLGGEQDEELMEDEESLTGWKQEIDGPFEIQMLDAGHFFINTHRDEVIDAVKGSLARHLHSTWPARVACQAGI
jgi:surfactin synthase thioesterase subunit